MKKQLIRSAAIVPAVLLLCHLLVSSAPAIENGGYPNGGFLVTTQWLAEHLNDPNVRILDRQDIEPDEDFYAQGHIPNSIRMPTEAIKGMRLGIPEMLIVKDLIQFLEEKGISQEHHVVIVGRCGRLPGTTRVFWALEHLGHKKASILDGGIDKWQVEKRPWVAEVPSFPKTSYKVNLKRDILATGDEVAGYIGSFKELNIVVVDCRRPDEFAGAKMSRESQKMGRIPGAINVVFPKILTGENYKEFKSAEDIRNVFNSEGITPDKNVFFSCVSGCFGTVLYFGARLLDFQKAAVYDGGWIEWSRKDYPVEGGPYSKGMGEVQKPPVKAAPPASAPSKPQRGC